MAKVATNAVTRRSRHSVSIWGFALQVQAQAILQVPRRLHCDDFFTSSIFRDESAAQCGLTTEGKLEIILAREPGLTLAPAAVNVVTVDLQGGIDVVKALRKEIVDAIDAGRLQDARRLMGTLASETVVNVNNIPLATYPVAIKQAVKLIDQNKVTRLKASLADARAQLERAEALGYGKKSDFVAFYQQLKEIDQKTADNKSGTGFFAKIEASIADFMKSIQPRKS